MGKLEYLSWVHCKIKEILKSAIKIKIFSKKIIALKMIMKNIYRRLLKIIIWNKFMWSQMRIFPIFN